MWQDIPQPQVDAASPIGMVDYNKWGSKPKYRDKDQGSKPREKGSKPKKKKKARIAR